MLRTLHRRTRPFLLHWAAALSLAICAGHAADVWHVLKPGLELASFPAGESSPAGDEVVTVLRVDPSLWDMEILCASQRKDRQKLTTREWCEQESMVAAINAGMYARDASTHVGFLAMDGLRCGRANRYQSVAAFGPRSGDKPGFRMFDLDSGASIKTIRKDYRYVVQNLRLIRRPGDNRWSDQTKIWSEAALGEDDQGRALLIFCRSPYSMHDFDQILLSLPLGLVCAQHLDGGPVAQMYVAAGGREVELVGSYETRMHESDANQTAWPIPNVIGVRPKPK
ncbi:MAG TPA: phosphodiester glycosidase family protein [bacterium]|nr:phosphodiester glycosidase family protein [bacterium]